MEFELYESEPGHWRWSLKDGKREKVLESDEDFVSKADLERAVSIFRNSVTLAPMKYVQKDELLTEGERGQ